MTNGISDKKSRQITAVEALEVHMENNRRAATFATVSLNYAQHMARRIDELEAQLESRSSTDAIVWSSCNTTDTPETRACIEATKGRNVGGLIQDLEALCAKLERERNAARVSATRDIAEGWVGTEESLPPGGMEVEAVTEDGSVLCNAILQHDGGWWWRGNFFDAGEVEYWRYKRTTEATATEPERKSP